MEALFIYVSAVISSPSKPPKRLPSAAALMTGRRLTLQLSASITILNLSAFTILLLRKSKNAKAGLDASLMLPRWEGREWAGTYFKQEAAGKMVIQIRDVVMISFRTLTFEI